MLSKVPVKAINNSKHIINVINVLLKNIKKTVSCEYWIVELNSLKGRTLNLLLLLSVLQCFHTATLKHPHLYLCSRLVHMSL